MWFLSPSGWPTWADDGSLFAQSLLDDGYQTIDDSQVQAAIDAYNARQPLPPEAVEFLTLDAARAAFATAEDLAAMLTAEEIATTVIVDPATVIATRTVPVFTALFPCKVEQVSLAFRAAVAASDTNYWTVELLRYRAGAGLVIAAKTTKTLASGGQGITAFADWNLDTITFGAAQEMAKGDVLVARFTPTGAPAALDGPAITFRTSPSDGGSPQTVLAADSFDRANTTAGLGVADTGQTWTILAGSHGISSGQWYSPTPTLNELAYLDVGAADIELTAKLAAVNGSLGLMLRVSDGNNSLMTNQTHLVRRASGTNTSVSPAFTTPFAAGDTIRVTAVGSAITVYRQAASVGDFVQVGTYTETLNQTVTKHGLRSSTNTGGANRIDDLVIRTPA